jgi:phosphonoacetaldehyde hydrolase
MTTPAIRLVVLDWAGTSIDFGCLAPAGAFAVAFAARGVDVTPAEARGPMGLHKKDHLRAMFAAPAVAAKWRAATGADWSETDVAALYADVTPRQVAAAERYSDLIPGLVAAVAELRSRGVKVATTTGYFRAAADVVAAAAARQGFVPDFATCADDVPAGRPAPWMIFRAMEATGVYPPAAVAKVGDTRIDVEDGLNAGVWSVGVTESSSEVGLGAAEFAALPAGERAARVARAGATLRAAGAHAVIPTVAELPALVADLNRRLAAGGRP